MIRVENAEERSDGPVDEATGRKRIAGLRVCANRSRRGWRRRRRYIKITGLEW